LRRVHIARFLLSVGLVLTACSGAKEPSPSIIPGFSPADMQYDFTAPKTTWDVFVTSGSEALFRVWDGALEGAVIANRGYVWSLANRRSNDSSIRAQVRQTQGSRGNGFGLLCRADEAGNGYYFLISSAGQFAILKASSDNPDPQPLHTWTFSEWIHTGTEPNDLEATCVNDYLLFFANGHFLAEVRDPTYTIGEPGVVLGAVEQTLWVRFDSIDLRPATIAGVTGR
jgi:hypothetical protein